MSLLSEYSDSKKCDKCNMVLPYIEYKGKKYCNWYCAKKGDK